MPLVLHISSFCVAFIFQTRPNQEAVSYLDIYRFRDKFATSALRGKRLNISMDLPRVQLKREAIGVIKMLTGDDVITVEEKFHNPEAYKTTAKPVFGSNFPSDGC